MTVLVIRANKRFAVRRQVRLTGGGAREQDGLLIEASLDGLRIAGIETGDLRENDCITVDLEGLPAMDGVVRWLNGRKMGLRLVRPLHIAELDRLIRTCRGEFDRARRAFGT